MKLNIVALNKNKHGFIKRSEQADLKLYLLGYIEHAYAKEKILYAPKYFAYQVDISVEKYITKYLGIGARGPRLGHTLQYRENYELDALFKKYEQFKEKYPDFSDNREQYYNRFPINKRKGTLGKNGRMYYKKRWLSEPMPDLKEIQKDIKHVLEDIFKIKYHDAAHAYTKGRTNITNARAHKYANHIVNIDLKDFFNTVDTNYLKTALCSLKEFAIIKVSTEEIKRLRLSDVYIDFLLEVREKAEKIVNIILDISPYNNALPQGSPLSPTLVNIAMLETDIKVGEYAKSKQASTQMMMYTRYSDDLTFSSFAPIKLQSLVDKVDIILKDTPMMINKEKIKYLKPTQKCYVTGVKINKDHNATYGHEKKAMLKNQIFNLLMAKKQGADIKDEAQKVLGNFAYMQSIEPAYTKNLIRKYSAKFGIPAHQIYKYLVN